METEYIYNLKPVLKIRPEDLVMMLDVFYRRGYMLRVVDELDESGIIDFRETGEEEPDAFGSKEQKGKWIEAICKEISEMPSRSDGTVYIDSSK